MFQIPNSSILFCMQRTTYRTIRNFETANRKCIRRLPPKLIIRYVIESYWPFALYELSKSQSEISSENPDEYYANTYYRFLYFVILLIIIGTLKLFLTPNDPFQKKSIYLQPMKSENQCYSIARQSHIWSLQWVDCVKFR